MDLRHEKTGQDQDAAVALKAHLPQQLSIVLSRQPTTNWTDNPRMNCVSLSCERTTVGYRTVVSMILLIHHRENVFPSFELAYSAGLLVLGNELRES